MVEWRGQATMAASTGQRWSFPQHPGQPSPGFGPEMKTLRMGMEVRSGCLVSAVVVAAI